MLINIHEKCTVNHATIPLQIYSKYTTIVKLHWNFPKILSQIHKKFYGKTHCQSYSRYIKNTQVLLLQIQFKFLLEVFRDAVKKIRKYVWKQLLLFFVAKSSENHGEFFCYKPKLKKALLISQDVGVY
jgi:hypothetical protein